MRTPSQVVTLDTGELLAGGWQPGCLLLVMPGGADLPYCKHLNGRGNMLIRGAAPCVGAHTPSEAAGCLVEHVRAARCPGCCAPSRCHAHIDFLARLPPPVPPRPAEYVEAGGSYLGLCAGAYYASARVEFEPGSRCVTCPAALAGCLLARPHVKSLQGPAGADCPWALLPAWKLTAPGHSDKA